MINFLMNFISSLELTWTESSSCTSFPIHLASLVLDISLFNELFTPYQYHKVVLVVFLGKTMLECEWEHLKLHSSIFFNAFHWKCFREIWNGIVYQLIFISILHNNKCLFIYFYYWYAYSINIAILNYWGLKI